MITSASLHFLSRLGEKLFMSAYSTMNFSYFTIFLTLLFNFLLSPLVETFINVKQLKLEELKFIKRMRLRNHTLNKDHCDFPISLVFTCQVL